MRRFGQLVITCAAMLIGSAHNAAQAGPIGTLYLTGTYNNGQTLGAIQGSSFDLSPAYSGYWEGPIAVFPSLGVVRTTGWAGNNQGGEYTGVPSLSVSQTGTTYSSQWASQLYYYAGEQGFEDYFFDGTTDGKFNYSVGFYSGAVVARDTSWGGAVTELFNLGAYSHNIGITYDKLNNSLWIQSHTTSTQPAGRISEYAMDGTLLSWFDIIPSTIRAEYTALAMDVDRTLWFVNYGSGEIQHYSTSGQFLGSDSYDGLVYAWGGEIGVSAVPEPGSLTLFGLGALGLAAGRNRLRRRATAK